MATDPYFADTDSSWWAPRRAEAQQLASLIREARLTLLCGPAGSGKSTLLQQGLMPLLQRRCSDAGAGPPDSRWHAPQWADRRRAPAGHGGELALLFDLWGERPAARLKSRLQDELGRARDTRVQPAPPLKVLLSQLHADTGVRFLIVLDAFETCLDPPAALADVAGRFIGELLDVIDDPHVPAHVLLALRDEAEPLLGRFHARIRGFDQHFLRLPARQDEPGEDTEAAPTEASISAALPPLPPREPMVTADLYESIAAALASVAPRATHIEPPLVSVEPASPSPALPPQPPEPIRAAPRRWPQRAALGGVLAAVLTLAWWFGGAAPAEPPLALAAPGALPRAAMNRATSPPAPPPATTPAGPAATIVSSEGPGSSTAQVSAEMAHWVAPAAGIRIQALPVAGWAEALGRLRDPGHLAIVRYDALRAARARPDLPPLQLVTPLFREELHLLVRADSPLQFIHQIKGRRMNVGAPGSSRALTAQTLYAGLTGQPLPAPQADAQDQAAALQNLLAGSGVEVLLHVDAQPSRWLASLPPAVASRLKLLRLDATNPASRRALRQFLPARLRDGDVPTLALMAFLVAPSGAGQSGPLAQGLCSQLDALRREGHPAWREVQPGLQLNVGWPEDDAAAQTFRRCADGGPPPSASPSDRGSTVVIPDEPRSRS